jgi:hypothetical protein
MNWNLFLTGPAQKHLRRLPIRNQGRVKDRSLTVAALNEAQDSVQSRDRKGAVSLS